MSRVPPLVLLLLAAAAMPAMAGRQFDFSPAAPLSDHQMDLRYGGDAAKPRYAMTYSDEAAQSLGVEGGKWEAFDTGHSSSEPFLPSLHGGVDSGAAMIKLQWR